MPVPPEGYAHLLKGLLRMATLAFLGCAPSPRTARIQKDPRPCLGAAGETEGGSERKTWPKIPQKFLSSVEGWEGTGIL